MTDTEFHDFMAQLRTDSLADDVPIVSQTNGKLLHFLVGLMGAKTVLEVGCANGYSTLWFAHALQSTDGHITTIDHSTPAADWARRNFATSGLGDRITLHFGRAQAVLPTLADQTYDIIFIDAIKKSYDEFWGLVQPMMHSSTLVIFDDVLKFRHKMEHFHTLMDGLHDQYEIITLPIDADDGTMLVRKR